jgi:hypothetical protein
VESGYLATTVIFSWLRPSRRAGHWHGYGIKNACPVYASWLDQAEIYFSVVQRKVLTPNDFTGLDQHGSRLHALA